MHVFNTYWMVTAIVDQDRGIEKSEIMRRLSEVGIDSRPMFDPLSAIPAYENTPMAAAARQRNHAAYAVSPNGINLPSGFNLTQPAVDHVVQQFLSIVNPGQW